MKSQVMAWEMVSTTRIKKTIPALKNHSASLLGSKIFIFGGYTGNKSSNAMYTLDCASFTWNRVRNIGLFKDDSGEYLAPRGRNGHSATVVGTNIYIIGGWVEDVGEVSDEVWRFDTSTLSWERLDTDGRLRCNLHSSVFLPERNAILVFRGGEGTHVLNDIHLLHLDTLKWELIIPNGTPPSPRSDHCASRIGSQVYIYGGWKDSQSFRDIHILNTRTEPFEWFSPRGLASLPSNSTGASLVAINDLLYLFGGSNSLRTCLNSVSIFNTRTMNWTQTELYDIHTPSTVAQRIGKEVQARLTSLANPNEAPSLSDSLILGKAPSQRKGHTATVIGRKILIIGGSTDSNNLLNDIYLLDTESPLTVPIKTPSVNVRMSEYFNKSTFSDIIFEIEGKTVFAHKLVLALKSEKFRLQFANKLFSEHQKAKIPIRDTSFEVFYLFLGYLYRDELPLGLSSKLIEPRKNSTAEEDDVFELERLTEDGIGDLLLDRRLSNHSFKTIDALVDTELAVQKGERELIAKQTGTIQFFREQINFDVFKTLIDLLYISDLYMVPCLKNKIENILQKVVTIETVDALGEHASRCNASQLAQFCELFQRNYVKSV